jgi:hypothetical protein
MRSRPRGRMAAMIGASLAVVGALGALGVNASASAATIHRLNVQLTNPVGSVFISAGDATIGNTNNGFCVRGPLGAGTLNTPYRVEGLNRVKVVTFSSKDCTAGVLAEQNGLVPDDDSPYYTITI